MTERNTREMPAIFCPGPTQRPHYSEGMVLGVDDFTAEMEYHRSKLRRHILRFHGYGVVEGLKVSAQKEASGWVVVIAPGVAIDPYGNEIELCTTVKLPLRTSEAVVAVHVRYAERLGDPVPALNSEAGMLPRRVEEGCEVLLVSSSVTETKNQKRVDAPHRTLSLARLVRRGPGWRVDRRFKSRRAG